MKIAIIQFPGSTGLLEIGSAIERAGMTPVVVNATQDCLVLEEMQGYVLPGGYSFDDEPSAGVIAAALPIMSLLAQQSELGKPILGIGNGAQILVASGLVPGVENNKRVVALTHNKRLIEGKLVPPQAYHAWANIKLSANYQRNAFTSKLNVNDTISMPLACSQGRFILSEALQYEIQIHGLNVFEYVDDVLGSSAHIAAISNKAGNILAIIPHPEYTPAGDAIFLSMKDYIDSGYCEKVAPLNYYPRQYAMTTYLKSEKAKEFIISTPALNKKAAFVSDYLGKAIQCFQHIEIDNSQVDIISLLHKAGLISEESEAIEVVKPVTGILVRQREDLLGGYLAQTYKKIFNVHKDLRVGYVWTGLSSEDLRFVFSPIAEDGYQYSA